MSRPMQVHDYIGLFLRNQAKPWQYASYQEIMNSQMYALIGCRQTGKSMLISLVAFSLALGYETMAGERVPAADVLIVSKDRSTSTNIISMVRKHLEAAQAITGKKAFRTDIGGKGDVYLMNGTRIVSMPGTPRSLQGFTGNVIVDELSANRWSIDEMMGQAMSVTSARSYFKLVVATNADVEGSYTHLFFESEDPRWVELRKNWRMRSVNIHDVYPDGLPDRLELRRRAMSQAMWQRFYLNKFIGSGAGLIEKDQFELVEKLPGGKTRYCIAIDPGFSEKGNPTGVCVLGFAGNRYYIAHGNLWFNKTVEEQEKYIKFLINLYRPEKLFIDAGAQGWHLAKKFESYSILEKVSVSQKYTDTCFNVLTNLLEEKRISIVTEDLVERSLPPSVGYEELLVDYCSVVPAMEQGSGVSFPQRVVRETDSRLLKAGALRTNRVHADSLLALLYACSWAAKAMTVSKVTVGMLPMDQGRRGGGGAGIY